MKTFRLIGMALLAVCVSFASCSDDDEPSKNDDGVITNQFRMHIENVIIIRRTIKREVAFAGFSTISIFVNIFFTIIAAIFRIS